MTGRRTFLAANAAALLAAQGQPDASGVPWYRRTVLWGQTNITEKDPERYDIPWWREFWKRTAVQGVILNAGGIVAYYPSKFPLQHRAEFLGKRDLYGDLAKAAHSDGLVVVARMDSNRASKDFLEAHPDWFTRDIKGGPYRAADKYITCVNSPYYDEYLPAVLTEIIERTHPEGFADNSWSGLTRDNICYCANCERKFKGATGEAIPRKQDWDSAAYRRWIDWNYTRRLEVWDLNNRATKAAGGAHCLWFGMNSGAVANQSRNFRDCKGVFGRAEMVFLDHQARGANGFEENADTGKLVHGILGWDKLAPESMAMYQVGRNSYRVASKPAAEARMWMIEGFAGGIQPWWHHIGAYHEDRRMYHTAEPEMKWYAANEQYLLNRLPVANVGIVWSQRNTDFYGRDHAADLVEAPYRGFTKALVRARIPYIPVHVDHVERESANLQTLILPNLAGMSDQQCAAVRDFAAKGGSVIATGATSLYTEFGDARPDFGLADLFGAHFTAKPGEEKTWATRTQHSYLRLLPELRSQVWGPKIPHEPEVKGVRHPALKGFEETDIMPFGGMLWPMTVDSGAVVALTFVPSFPIYPPETAWMRQPITNIPGLIIKGRTAFLPADIDRRYARESLPDYGNLLSNLVRWAARDDFPLRLEGPGLFDCNLYRQPARLIAHVVNLTAKQQMPIDELLSVGPMKLRLRLQPGNGARRAKLLVSGVTAKTSFENGWAHVSLDSVLDHEVIVVE